MPTGHPILAEFQAACQEYYACFVFAKGGLKHSSDQLLQSGQSPAGTRVFISAEDPTKRKATATIDKTQLQKLLTADGHFADALAKSLLVTIYAEWDEYFRPRFAASVGAKPSAIRCNLLGDLRHIRNCIVHAKSIITSEHTKLKTLTWTLTPGPLVITGAMFTQFIELTHELIVELVPEKP